MTITWTPLWSDIVDSSVWETPKHVKILWITMLAMKDRSGFVSASRSGLARRAVLTTDEVDDGLKVLSSPDRDSKSRDHDGRRIEEVEGGWRILNHERMLRRIALEKKRLSDRIRQAEHREKKKGLPAQHPGPEERDYVAAVRRGEDPDGHEVAAVEPGPKGGWPVVPATGRPITEGEVSGASDDLPVELPPGFPRTEEEAITQCMSLGVPDAQVVIQWNMAMARGGMDARGQQIRRFAHWVKAMTSIGDSRKAEKTMGFEQRTAPETIKIKEMEL